MKKPAISNIGRPQGIVDDIIKNTAKAVVKAVKRNPVFKGSIMPKKGGMPRRQFEKIYGAVEPNPRFASPKVQQQIARSKTKRRAMAKTEKMATKYYGK